MIPNLSVHPGSLCIRMKPNPKSLDASHNNLVSNLGSNGVREVDLVSASLLCLISALISGVNPQSTLDLKRVLIRAVECATSGAQWLSWFTSPRNDLSSEVFLGSGKLAIALSKPGSGSISTDLPSVLDRMKPAYLTLLPHCSFFLLNVMPCSRPLSRTIFTRSASSCSVLA